MDEKPTAASSQVRHHVIPICGFQNIALDFSPGRPNCEELEGKSPVSRAGRGDWGYKGTIKCFIKGLSRGEDL